MRCRQGARTPGPAEGSPLAQREDALDALEALRPLAHADVAVTDQMLRDLVDDLNRCG